MSTRFYLPGMINTWGGDPITQDGVWSGYNAAMFSRADLLLDKTTLDSMNGFGLSEEIGANTPIQQFISPPLAAQTITGMVKGVIRAREDAGAMASAVVVIRVLSGDGQTVRGTVLSYVPGTLVSEFPEIIADNAAADSVNRYFPPPSTALTDLAIEDGDRLCIEIGFKNFNESYLDGGGYVRLGVQDVGDLSENETGTDDLDPWIEFSQDIILQSSVTGLDVVGSGYVSMGGGNTMVAVGFDKPRLDVVADDMGLHVGGGDTYDMLLPSEWIEPAPGIQVGISGGGTVAVAYPRIIAIEGAVSLAVSGGNVIGCQRPIAIVGSGRVEVGGRGLIACLRPAPADIVATGGVRVSSYPMPESTCIRPANTILEVISSGRVEVGGGCLEDTNWERVLYPEITDIVPTPARIRIGGDGGASVYYPPVMAIVSAGTLLIGGGSIEEAAYETWVITGVEHQPSIYSGFQFNSYAEFRGLHYGCADDGIYLMNQDGAGDDDGREIHPGIRIGPTNFGAGTKKFIRSIHPGKAGGKTRVMVSGGQKDSYPIPHAGQFVGKRDHVEDEFIIDIGDFDKLGRAEIVAMILPRR